MRDLDSIVASFCLCFGFCFALSVLMDGCIDYRTTEMNEVCRMTAAGFEQKYESGAGTVWKKARPQKEEVK